MARILVIEDNLANMQLMVYLLEAFGHEPVEADTGERGLELTRQDTFDLILCDIQLPRLDGYGVAKELKLHPNLKRTPLVAVTALAMVGDRDKVLAAGFDGYIPKPTENKVFLDEINRHLAVR